MTEATKSLSIEIASADFLTRFFEIAEISPSDRVLIVARVLAKISADSVTASPDAVAFRPPRRKAGRPKGSKNRPRFNFPRQQGEI